MTEDLSESAAEELSRLSRYCSEIRKLMYEAQQRLEAEQKIYLQRREEYGEAKSALNEFLRNLKNVSP